MTAYTIPVVYAEVTVVARVGTGDRPPGSNVGVTVIVVVMTGASYVGGYPGVGLEVQDGSPVVVE
jgi:hypothetical protein